MDKSYARSSQFVNNYRGSIRFSEAVRSANAHLLGAQLSIPAGLITHNSLKPTAEDSLQPVG